MRRSPFPLPPGDYSFGCCTYESLFILLYFAVLFFRFHISVGQLGMYLSLSDLYTSHNSLQFHPYCYKWQDLIFVANFSLCVCTMSSPGGYCHFSTFLPPDPQWNKVHTIFLGLHTTRAVIKCINTIITIIVGSIPRFLLVLHFSVTTFYVIVVKLWFHLICAHHGFS